MKKEAPRRRQAGILAHPTSLPSPYGIGDMGPGLDTFLDWIRDAGQTLWQILPLGPTGLGNSPYGAVSAFAGNPLLISPQRLLEEGLISEADVVGHPKFRDDRVDFGPVQSWKESLLRKSWSHFRSNASPALQHALHEFVDAPAQGWLTDWSLFLALKAKYQGKPWPMWSRDLARRDADAIVNAAEEVREEIEFHDYVQFLFLRQWERVKVQAHKRGISIVGDLPIYLGHDSPDVWANAKLFLLDQDFWPIAVSGVPPDYFSKNGQRWGNPLYRWDRIAEEGYAWWISRLELNLRLTDLIRIDHFRAFAAYWEVPAHEETAIHGSWRPGPGYPFFKAVRERLGDLPLIAEDLGLITPDVDALRNHVGIPGMRVLQFGFSDAASPHLPHKYEPHTVVYTGTHDNDTTRGWFRQVSAEERRRILAYIGGTGHDIEWDMIRVAYNSVAELAIVPLQDVFSLGSEARMNTPGEGAENWTWRARQKDLTSERAKRLRTLAELSARG